MNPYLLRIKEIIEEKNLSETAFAKAIGVRQSTLNNLFNRDSTPKIDIMTNISNTFGVSPVWLLTGEGEMYNQNGSSDKLGQAISGLTENRARRGKTSSPKEEYKNVSEAIRLLEIEIDILSELMLENAEVIEEGYKPSGLVYRKKYHITDRDLLNIIMNLQEQRTRLKTRQDELALELPIEFIEAYHADEVREEMNSYVSEPFPEYGAQQDIPLYEGVAAGEPLESFDTGETYSVSASRLHGNPDKYFAIRVRGSSMVNAGIHDGDVAIIRKEEELVSGQIILARHDGEYTLKRYIEAADGRVRLAYEDGSGRSVEMVPGQWEKLGVFCFVE